MGKRKREKKGKEEGGGKEECQSMAITCFCHLIHFIVLVWEEKGEKKKKNRREGEAGSG